MLTEMLGKAGKICQPALDGKLRCPLIVRPTSEDVVTGNLFLALKVLNPRWWLPDMLNAGLRARRFQQQVFRGLQIDLWRNRPRYLWRNASWDEGSTQVDATIRWENPPTTVYVEMKYGSELSPRTSSGEDAKGFPSDQLIRNARVGLLECGYFQTKELFGSPQRIFALLVVSPITEQPLVAKYRRADATIVDPSL